MFEKMRLKRYENLVAVLHNKKNIILQGAPGVGKTFAARRLAWSMMGEKDDNRIEFVQFHQNYSYEDFMMGYKPVEDGFELKFGIFYRFCQKAANQPDKEFFFIIDEINRGNMSKIFGELLMLIEKDYRGTKATLAYNGLSFSVPKNLYIIGMYLLSMRSIRDDNSELTWVMAYPKAEYANNEDSFDAYYDRVEVCDDSAQSHPKAAIQIRNRNMVDRSDWVICYVDHESGGAFQTMQYAQKCGKDVINLALEEL